MPSKIHKCDVQLGSLEYVRKTVRWYIILFTRLLVITILNAFNVYLFRSHRTLKYLDFHYKVIFQPLEIYSTLTTSERGRRFDPLPDRLAVREVLQLYYLTPTESIGGEREQILCFVCRNSSRRDNLWKKATSWCQVRLTESCN